MGRAADLLVRLVDERIRVHLKAFVSAGNPLAGIEAHADHLAEVMVKSLPQPTAAAAVSGPVWTTEQVRLALGRGRAVSRQAVDDRVRRGTLLALRVQEERERAYPLWQFSEENGTWRVLPGLADVLRAVPEDVADRWTLASWLQQPNPGLEDETPLALLKRGDVDHVRRAALAAAERW